MVSGNILSVVESDIVRRNNVTLLVRSLSVVSSECIENLVGTQRRITGQIAVESSHLLELLLVHTLTALNLQRNNPKTIVNHLATSGSIESMETLRSTNLHEVREILTQRVNQAEVASCQVSVNRVSANNQTINRSLDVSTLGVLNERLHILGFAIDVLITKFIVTKLRIPRNNAVSQINLDILIAVLRFRPVIQTPIICSCLGIPIHIPVFIGIVPCLGNFVTLSPIEPHTTRIVNTSVRINQLNAGKSLVELSDSSLVSVSLSTGIVVVSERVLQLLNLLAQLSSSHILLHLVTQLLELL